MALVVAGLVAAPSLLAVALWAGDGAGDVGPAAEAPPLGGAFTVAIVPPEAGGVACPEPPQLADALAARLPGVTAQVLGAGGDALDGASAGDTLLDLVLSPAGSARVLLTLRRRAGAPVLERLLPAARPGGPRTHGANDCVALADTVALIVERYLRQVGYHGPNVVVPQAEPPPPVPLASGPVRSPAPVARTEAPPPSPEARRTARAYVGALAGWAAPAPVDRGDARAAPFVAVSADVRLARLALVASAAVGEAADSSPAPLGGGGSLRVRPWSLRAGVGLPIALGPGDLLPALGGGVDVIATEWRLAGERASRARTAVDPVVEAAAGYVLPVGDWFDLSRARGPFVAFRVSASLDLRPRDFVVEGPAGSPTIYRPARVNLLAGLEVGWALGIP